MPSRRPTRPYEGGIVVVGVVGVGVSRRLGSVGSFPRVDQLEGSLWEELPLPPLSARQHG